jgi:chromosome segregation ATPase
MEFPNIITGANVPALLRAAELEHRETIREFDQIRLQLQALQREHNDLLSVVSDREETIRDLEQRLEELRVVTWN